MNPLVICSNGVLCEGLIRLIRRAEDGSTPAVAASFRQALAGLALQRPALLLLCAELDDIDIWTALAVLKARADTPSVALVAAGGDEDVRRAIKAGALGYLPQYANVAVLLTGLRQVMRGTAYWPQDLRVARPRGAGALGRLTPRQMDVLAQIKNGKSNKEIARALRLAEGTIKIHCMAIFRELGVSNRTQAAIRAAQLLP